MVRVKRSRVQREASAALGRRIAAFRKGKGITQVELSQRMKISQPVISHYESGRLRAPPEFILKFADIVGVSTDQVLGREKAEKADEHGLDRRFLRRLKVVQGLPKRDQDALLRTIDAFITARAAR